jgi:Glycosyl transferase family 2
MKPLASVIIPAHNEARSIERLLRALLADAAPGELEVVVVCNGCTDDTGAIARAFPDVLVEEIPVPSKHAALRRGDALATVTPRVYLDADLELGTRDLRTLVAELDRPGVEAVGPRRVMRCDASSWPVRSYYRVWEQLPQVRVGLFGRGVIAVSGAGLSRIIGLPAAMSDDLAVSEAFTTDERAVAPAQVVIHPPRTVADLLRRRVRVATGTGQLRQAGAVRAESTTRLTTLLDIVRTEPARAGDAVVFLTVTALARVRARRRLRRHDFTTWDRDESSRDR